MALKPTELGELLDVLRAKGVVEFKHHDETGTIMLKFGPAEASSSEVPAKRGVKAAFQEMMAPTRKPRGPDGLTAEQQEEVYGVVLDDIPDSPED
jgi:hypothetical protein